MMQETQNNELFSDISTEESVPINGGHSCGCNGHTRAVNYVYRHPRYYYGSYHKPYYKYRYSSYSSSGYNRYRCY